METAVIKHTEHFDFSLNGRYSSWRKEFEKVPSDYILKILKNQVIIARVYTSIAHSKRQNKLFHSLLKSIKDSRNFIGEANSDVELKKG